MLCYEDNQIKKADTATQGEILRLPLFTQQVSLWQGCGVGKGFYFKYNTTLSDLISKILDYNLLTLHEKHLIDGVKSGILRKADSFGFCVATFPYDAEAGKVRRLKNSYSSFTKLITLDIDLYHEPDFNEQKLTDVQQGLFENTLGLSEYILLSGRSISGKGLYLYLLTDSEDTHVLEVVVEKIYEHINTYFRFQNPEQTLDRTAKDIINRVRYFSPDENLILNPRVSAIDTTTTKNKVHSKLTVSTPAQSLEGNTYREQLEIQWYYRKHLSKYDHKIYHTGMHRDFLTFANACLFKGVTKQSLVTFTTETYRDLYNKEKGNYLPELLRNIDCAQDNIKRQSNKK